MAAKKKKSARGGADARKAMARIAKASKDLQLNLKKIKTTFEEFHYFGPGQPIKPRGK